MDSSQNFSLKAYNTFGFPVKAKRFYAVKTEEELVHLLKKNYADELFILGGGSNILLTENLNRAVLHIDLKGISIVNESDKTVLVRARAGENWHHFVRYCVTQGYGGIENLSLIPGNVGSTPIQNIGAYGVEMQDCFVECEALHRQTLEKRTFQKEDCHFGYRDSVFKKELKNQYVITSVTFKLSKKHHALHTGYGAIKKELDAMGITHPTIDAISRAVIHIRKEKLPDPAKLGNSGSFFKNPIIPEKQFLKLQKEFPAIRYYKLPNGHYKIPAGWLIDQAGFKGYRQGDAGVHKNQALVLINYGKATGQEILQLAQTIQRTIVEQYGLSLEMEVNIV